MTIKSASWLADAYGGKRPFLRYLASRALATLGSQAALGQPDFSSVTRMVFVCQGNVCRSPFAEQLARAAGLDVASAGLDADAGQPAHPVAVKLAARRGVDLRHHRSRRFDELELRPGDLLIAFETVHALRLQQLLREQKFQFALLGLFGSTPCGYLHDPYGLSDAYFEACFARIEDALRGLRRQYEAASAIARPA